MDLTYEQIMDYYRCPLLYNFKHVLNLKRQSEAEFYKDSLQKTIMFFYYQVMNGNTPSLEVLNKKWYKISNNYENFTIEDILFKKDRTGVSNKNFRSEQLKLIKTFYEIETSKKFIPIVVDTDIRVQVGDYHVKDTLELVREIELEDSKKVIEVVRFNTSIYKPLPFLIRHDFKLSLQSYAFRKLFKTKEDRLVLYGLKNGYISPTTRDQEEFKRLETIINNVGDSIADKKFHPIITHQCKQCLYQDVCNKYKF